MIKVMKVKARNYFLQQKYLERIRRSSQIYTSKLSSVFGSKIRNSLALFDSHGKLTHKNKKLVKEIIYNSFLKKFEKKFKVNFSDLLIK